MKKEYKKKSFNEENNSLKMTNLLKPNPFTGFLSAEHAICDGNLTPERKNNHWHSQKHEILLDTSHLCFRTELGEDRATKTRKTLSKESNV
jgi:hypothetical protein